MGLIDVKISDRMKESGHTPRCEIGNFSGARRTGEGFDISDLRNHVHGDRILL